MYSFTKGRTHHHTSLNAAPGAAVNVSMSACGYFSRSSFSKRLAACHCSSASPGPPATPAASQSSWPHRPDQAAVAKTSCLNSCSCANVAYIIMVFFQFVFDTVAGSLVQLDNFTGFTCKPGPRKRTCTRMLHSGVSALGNQSPRPTKMSRIRLHLQVPSCSAIRLTTLSREWPYRRSKRAPPDRPGKPARRDVGDSPSCAPPAVATPICSPQTSNLSGLHCAGSRVRLWHVLATRGAPAPPPKNSTQQIQGPSATPQPKRSCMAKTYQQLSTKERGVVMGMK